MVKVLTHDIPDHKIKLNSVTMQSMTARFCFMSEVISVLGKNVPDVKAQVTLSSGNLAEKKGWHLKF